jgi:protein subunit release factor A
VAKKLLFSITKKDLEVTYFSGTGGGGQHRNKHKNCVRIKHPDSGAIVTGQSHKERKSNIKEALNNLVSNGKFKVWHSIKVHEVLEGEKIEEKIDKMMHRRNLKIELRRNGWWEEEEE